MFEKLKVKWQLAIGFAAVVAVFSITLLVIGFLLSNLTRNISQINEKVLPNILIVEEMNLSRSEVQQFLTDVSATHDTEGYQEAEKYAQLFQGGIDKFRQYFRQTNDLESLKQLTVVEADFNIFYASGKVMAAAYVSQGMEAGNLLMKGSQNAPGFDAASEALSIQLNKFREHQLNAAQKNTADALAAAQFIKSGMMLGGLAAVLLAAMFGSLIVRLIWRQLGGEPDVAAVIAQRVGAGNLSASIDLRPGDTSSLMAHLKVMQESLIQVVSNVRHGSVGVATASAAIAHCNNDLSARTEQQASALEQTAATMEELDSNVKQNSDNAKKASQLALNACTVAVKGGEVVAQVVDTMKGINEASRKISDIISVMDGIAFQTNILALNAAVEAARAGEQGRGFAVVASEVRSLAGRSADAAKEIKKLINTSVERVAHGTVLVDQAGTTMIDVVSSIRRVTDLMGASSTASSEQSLAVSQVGAAVTQMDVVTQQNATLVDEMAAAASSLKSQAHDLVQVVAVFTLGNHDSFLGPGDRQALRSKPRSLISPGTSVLSMRELA